MKLCKICGETKPFEEFNKKSSAADLRQRHCRSCHSKYLKEHYRKNRQAYLDKSTRNSKAARNRNRKYLADWLSNHPCVDCGETEIEVLQFDHVTPRSEGTGEAVSYRMSGSLEKLKEEVARCEIRCANCHLRRTRRMQGWSYR